MLRGNLPLALLLLLLAVALGKEQQASQHWRWNYRDGADKVNIGGVHSITRLLDLWGNRIFKQMKFTMLSHPQDVLPDYSRIQPFSEALDDLFREARTLKRRLGDLAATLAVLERSFAQVGYGRPAKIKRVVVVKKVPRKQPAHRSSQRASPWAPSFTAAHRRPAGRRPQDVSDRQRSRVSEGIKGQ
ncbi:uncharacterized protein LOC144611393 [Rhinoraja longicauda]